MQEKVEIKLFESTGKAICLCLYILYTVPMFLKDLLRPLFSTTSPLLLFYHKMMAVIAAVYYGFPARKLKVIGVTGTNGKTTVVNLIAKILTEHGAKVGMASTVNFQMGGEVWMNETKMSTQSAFFIQKFLKRLVKAECEYAILEVTSHALLQSRTWGVDFDVVLVTNVTGDHIEYHGGFDNYLQAKGLLFEGLMRGMKKSGARKVAISNHDDRHFDYFHAFPADLALSYGLEKGSCFASDIVLGPVGTTFLFHHGDQKVSVNVALPGLPNVSNVLAAATVAVSQGVSLEIIARALSHVEPVAGRYELIDCGQPFHVVVDYAHNIDAVENIVKMYKGIVSGKGKLITVFGATGGGRDKAKRPVMGKILDEHVDYLIITDDDPYEEDEWEIISMVDGGISRKEGDRYWKIPRRYEAIRLALALACEGDIVLIAGKGAEPIQMVYGERRAWDDRAVARELLSVART